MDKEISISLEEFESYLEIRYSKNTTKQYASAFRSYADGLLTQEDIDDFVLTKVFDKDNNPFYMGFVKAYIDCFNLPFIVPVSKRKKPKVRKAEKFLEKEQVDLLINESDTWISLIVRVMFDTGLRLRELIDLKKEGIDLSDRSLSGMGKGNKPFNVKFSFETKDKIKEWLSYNDREFPFHYGDHQKDYGKSFWRYLKLQGEALGIPNCHPHRIRHALGHYLRCRKGFDLQQIKTKLRHSDLGSTQRYTPATADEVDQKMEDEVFN